jgi:hypothetical protein
VKEYNAKVDYIHWNPVKAGLVSRPEEWPWSSVYDYTGSAQRPVAPPGGLAVDRVLLPADERTGISRYGQEKPQRNAKGAYLCATRYPLLPLFYNPLIEGDYASKAKNRGQTGRFRFRAIVVLFARGSIHTRHRSGHFALCDPAWQRAAIHSHDGC